MRRLGQHFLKSKSVVKRIVETAGIEKNDVILEVGPGKGILTEELLKHSQKVIAVEKDKRLFDFLKEKFKDCANLLLIQGDILKIHGRLARADRAKRRSQSPQRGDRSLLLSLALSPSATTVPARLPQHFSPRCSPRQIIPKNYKIVANIPYYITSRFLRNFLSAKHQPQKVILMVQKEVAERICAIPPRMNLLAISVQVFGTPKILFNVAKNNFSPAPKVDSAVIAINDISRNFFSAKGGSASGGKKTNEEKFFELVKTGFSRKRKLLLGNLSKIQKKETVEQIFKKCKIPLKSRAENLALTDWKCLLDFAL